MAATPLSASTRYFPPGTRQYYWVPAISNTASPTRPELDAGTDLTGEVIPGGVSGFTTTSDSIDAPDMDSRFTARIPGRITAEDSSLELYTSEDSDDARTLLARDEEGFIVVFPEGDTAGRKMNVFPVTVAASSVTNDNEEAGKLHVDFTVTDVPQENVTIPA